MQGIRVRVCFALIFATIIASLIPTAIFAIALQAQPAQTSGPRIWLGERQQLPMQAAAAPRSSAAFLSAFRRLAPPAK
jgi:hypothetical protein